MVRTLARCSSTLGAANTTNGGAGLNLLLIASNGSGSADTSGFVNTPDGAACELS